MSGAPENLNPPEAKSPQNSTSATVQIAQAVADVIKEIGKGIPTGKLGMPCRFLIILEVLLTLYGIVAMLKSNGGIVWGCLIGMVAGGAVLMFLYGTSNDSTLAVG